MPVGGAPLDSGLRRGLRSGRLFDMPAPQALKAGLDLDDVQSALSDKVAELQSESSIAPFSDSVCSVAGADRPIV
jgi:hypothetical protein